MTKNTNMSRVMQQCSYVIKICDSMPLSKQLYQSIAVLSFGNDDHARVPKISIY